MHPCSSLMIRGFRDRFIALICRLCCESVGIMQVYCQVLASPPPPPLPLPPKHTHSRIYAHDTHAHAHTHSHTLSLRRTHTLSLSLSHTHTHTHRVIHARTQPHSYREKRGKRCGAFANITLTYSPYTPKQTYTNAEIISTYFYYYYSKIMKRSQKHNDLDGVCMTFFCFCCCCC